MVKIKGERFSVLGFLFALTPATLMFSPPSGLKSKAPDFMKRRKKKAPVATSSPESSEEEEEKEDDEEWTPVSGKQCLCEFTKSSNYD